MVELPILQADRPMDYTWRNDGSIYMPGKLDYAIISDGVVEAVHMFGLQTQDMSSARLAQYGLQSGDTWSASDHLPIVVDLAMAGGEVQDADEDGDADRCHGRHRDRDDADDEREDAAPHQAVARLPEGLRGVRAHGLGSFLRGFVESSFAAAKGDSCSRLAAGAGPCPSGGHLPVPHRATAATARCLVVHVGALPAGDA